MKWFSLFSADKIDINIDKSSWNSFLPVLVTIDPQETNKQKKAATSQSSNAPETVVYYTDLAGKGSTVDADSHF